MYRLICARQFSEVNHYTYKSVQTKKFELSKIARAKSLAYAGASMRKARMG